MLTDRQLLRVRSGALSFNRFAREARPDFQAMASRVLARFPSLYTLDVDDLVQVMLLQAFIRVGTWRPDHQYPIKKYVVWWAHSRALKLCHHQLRRSRVIMLAKVPFGDRDGARLTSMFEGTQQQLPLQELEVEVVERLRDLPTTQKQIAVMNSVFETQDVDRSLDDLLRDPRTRRMFGGDRTAARRSIYRTVTRLTKRAHQLAR